MAKILIQIAIADGHMNPVLPIVENLCHQGHEILWIGGRSYREKIEQTGARFYPIPEYWDPQDMNFYEFRPEIAKLQGIKQVKHYLKHEFLGFTPTMFEMYEDIKQIFTPEIILSDAIGYPIYFLAEKLGIPSVNLHMIPIIHFSKDSAPFGTGLLPGKGIFYKLRNIFLNSFIIKFAFRDVVAHATKLRKDQGLPALTSPDGNGLLRLAQKVLYMTVPSFEYPRLDILDSVEFIGPYIAKPKSDFQPPSWWNDIKGDKPIILVNQGTIANNLDDLIKPTIEGLKTEDVIVIAVPVKHEEEMDQLPENVRTAEFIPFANLMPYVDVMITNGGYGGTHIALAHGVPMVMAGNTDDKMEVSARVQWSGTGINLRSQKPSPQKIKQAVRTILADNSYKKRAMDLQDEISCYDPVLLASEAINDCINQNSSLSRKVESAYVVGF